MALWPSHLFNRQWWLCGQVIVDKLLNIVIKSLQSVKQSYLLKECTVSSVVKLVILVVLEIEVREVEIKDRVSEIDQLSRRGQVRCW